MKLRRVLILCVGLASLWCGMGPARADWGIYLEPAQGYPIRNPEGGSGKAFQTISSVSSNESSNLSGLSGTTASPDYEQESKVSYIWDGAGPPPPLTLTFTATASASFSNNNSSCYGSAGAGASTDAAHVQAGVSVTSNGSAADSPPSETVPLGSNPTHSFNVSANSYGHGYIYGANQTGGNSSFTTGSSSTMSFNQ